MVHGSSPARRRAFVVLTAVLAVTVVVLAVLGAINHEHFGSERLRHLGLPSAGLLAIVAGTALLLWRRDVSGAHDDVEDRIAEAKREGEARERTLRDELQAERVGRARAERGRRVEHEWAAELREQVVRMHRQHGPLGAGNVRSMVLQLAMELLEADKGLLLSRNDRDGDGHLELVERIGFEHDPSDSAITQRLASQVLAHDEILHEDDRTEIDRESRTPADDEIENLVAIPVYIAGEFDGVVVCANRDGGFADCEDELLLALGDHAGAVLSNGRLQGQLRSAYLATVMVLSEAIEAKDPFLKGHSEDVAALVAAVADRLGIEPAHREELIFASLLHDVGKLGISEHILRKPAALTAEEYAAIQLHPRIGFRIVERVPALRAIAPAVLHHHERFDGAGYPAGLRGNDIPLDARIVAVADAYSAMTQERPYRAAMETTTACERLLEGAGSQFDPEVARIFVEEVRRGAGRGERIIGSANGIEDTELLILRGGDDRLMGAGALELTDALTLLYSHRHFHESATALAHQAAAQDGGFTVVVGELSELDAVNRTEGFAAGDAALRSAARRFEAAAADQPSGLAARLGGCRFALLSADPTAGPALCARIAAPGPVPAGLRTVAATWQPPEEARVTIGRALAALAAGRVQVSST